MKFANGSQIFAHDHCALALVSNNGDLIRVEKNKAQFSQDYSLDAI
jgi:hypothetical protein